jgi:hypothetical protein
MIKINMNLENKNILGFLITNLLIIIIIELSFFNNIISEVQYSIIKYTSMSMVLTLMYIILIYGKEYKEVNYIWKRI